VAIFIPEPTSLIGQRILGSFSPPHSNGEVPTSSWAEGSSAAKAAYDPSVVWRLGYKPRDDDTSPFEWGGEDNP